MGCPAKKVVASQHGSALMKDSDTACRIVEAVRSACSLEVSVKTRLGWSDSTGLIPFARKLESAGVSLLTIHGRTYQQAYKGQADWNPIYELKQHLAIPVIGNGDVQNYADGMNKLKNLDGFMIGRKAIGNPWVFQNPETHHPPTLVETVTVAQEHYRLLRTTLPERIAIREFRKHLSEYIQGFYHAKEWRTRLVTTDSETHLFELMERLKEQSGMETLAKAG
ncbi:MAG: tRNA-dihydrouridine synthase family protein [SAR324 cluster bacterium]|nr:tRNA-dihydrouridine synthase family protein [SAR324 cluster bacterium]